MKTYLIFLFSLLLCSCHSPSNKEIAQNKVNDYLIKEKNSYESILFGELDSAFTSVKNTSEYERNNNLSKIYELYSHNFLNNIDDVNQLDIYSDSMKYFNTICDSLELIFNPEFIGWKIQHIYKYKNSKNELVVDNHDYFFDESLQTITNDEQVYTNLPFKTYAQDKDFYGLRK